MSQVRPVAFQVSRRSEPPSWIGQATGASVNSVFQPAADPAQTQAAAAAQRLERELAEARARAEAEGRARTEAEGRARWEGELAKLRELCADLSGARLRLLTEMENLMVDLALVVSETIVGREMEQHPEHVLRLVREAVAMVADGGAIEIAVAPSCYPLVTAELAAISQQIPKAGELVVKSDENVGAGCVVETKHSRVDATVATRLRNVADSLHAIEEN